MAFEATCVSYSGVRVACHELAELADARALVLAQQAEHLVARGRALHRDHREVAALGDAGIERAGLRTDPRQVLLAGRGVDHQPEEILGEEIHDQVVDDPALLVEHAGVERLAGFLQLVDRVGEQVPQERAHVGTMQVDHGHVADVEHAGVAAHQVVLVDLRAVVDRHVPAAEIDHLGAERAMGLVEDRLLGHPPGRGE